MRKYFYSLATDQRWGLVAGILKLALFLLSYLYWLGIKSIRLSYSLGISRSHRLNCKVISIGNITWGGTGKTPLVQMLAKKLKGMGESVAILTRGYGADEPRILAKNLTEMPVLVGRNRVKSGQSAIDEYGVGSVILDDGFQHWRIARDVDILTINSLNPFGNAYLIPRGILREPLEGLRRADLFFLTKSDLIEKDALAELKERLKRINPDAAIIESIHRPVGLYSLAEKERIGLEALRDEEVATLSGIGDPESFRRTVEALGAKILLNFAFLDHHRYTAQDLKKVFDSCLESNVKTIVTTEKDMVRLRNIIESAQCPVSAKGGGAFDWSSSQLRILALMIQLEITGGEEKLDDILSTIFSG